MGGPSGDLMGSAQWSPTRSIVGIDPLDHALRCQQVAFPNVLSCYSTNEGCTNRKLKELCTRVTNSTLLYKDLHLPQTTQLVSKLEMVFMMYESLDIQTFRERIQTIAEEVEEMAKDAKFMVAIHVQLRGDLLLIQLGSTRTATNGRAEFFSAQADTVKKETENDKKNCSQEDGYKVVPDIVFGKAAMATTASRCLMTSSPVIGTAATGGSAQAFIPVGATGIVGLGGVGPAAAGCMGAMATSEEGKEAESEGRAQALAASNLKVNQLMRASRGLMDMIDEVLTFFTQLEAHVVRCLESVESAQFHQQRRRRSSTYRAVKMSTVYQHFIMLKDCSSMVLEACDRYAAYVPATEAAQAMAHLHMPSGSAKYIRDWLKKHNLKLAIEARGGPDKSETP